MNYFAYIHCKPDGTPFYVGKGKLRRAKNLGERNPHHNNTVKKYGAENILVGMLECSSEEAAYDLEVGVIKCLRRSGFSLTNQNEGGKGGSRPTEDTRKRLSLAAKKRGISESCRQACIKARKGKALTDKQKKKQSEAMKGIVFSEEHRANISKSAKKRGISQKTRDANIRFLSKPVVGVHPDFGICTWGSAKQTALAIGSPISTTSKKIKSKMPCMGWVLRYMT